MLITDDAPASDDTGATRLATRLSFFVAGFSIACWAPLVPYAKSKVAVDERELGLLLLCLGIGSIVAMPLTGWISARVGSKPMILAGGFGLVLVLPLLAMATGPLMLAAALLVFGASLGTLDVAMNVHAVEVEKAARRLLMSGFHAMYSLGGIVGAGGVTLMLSRGASPLTATISASAISLVAMVVAWPRLLTVRGEAGPAFVAPQGLVLLLAALAGVVFLVEGGILDWSALLIEGRLVAAAQGGLGYMLFAVAMTIGRLTGDSVVRAVGDRQVLVGSGVVTIAGFGLLLMVPWPPLALTGFILIGFGASNIVPVLFTLAGRQTIMPAGLAVAAVTTTGYAGVLVGPAAVGFVAHLTNLPTAFWMLAALMVLVPVFARTATRV